LATPKNIRESPQRVFLDVFRPPEHNSKLYFSAKASVQVLGNLSTFAVQHCTPEGNWASDLMQIALAANLVNYGTWNTFKAAFEKQFVPLASQIEAISKIHFHPMGMKSFATWFQKWSTKGRQTGVDKTTKIWAFQRNLPPILQQKLLTLFPQPTTLDTLIEKAWEFDHNWEIFGMPSGTSNRGHGSSQGNWRGNQNPQIQEIKEETGIEIAVTQSRCETSRKWGKLTKQERQHRRANNLCLYCGTAGHIAVNCPLS